MKIHELKTDPDVFDAVLSGEKTYEIRYNDRDYQVGDILILKKTLFSAEEMKRGGELKFTGDEIKAKVSHILQGQYGLVQGWCILSLEDLPEYTLIHKGSIR